MSIRTRMILVIFFTGFLGVAALVADRSLATREVFYGLA